MAKPSAKRPRCSNTAVSRLTVEAQEHQTPFNKSTRGTSHGSVSDRATNPDKRVRPYPFMYHHLSSRRVELRKRLKAQRLASRSAGIAPHEQRSALSIEGGLEVEEKGDDKATRLEDFSSEDGGQGSNEKQHAEAMQVNGEGGHVGGGGDALETGGPELDRPYSTFDGEVVTEVIGENIQPGDQELERPDCMDGSGVVNNQGSQDEVLESQEGTNSEGNHEGEESDDMFEGPGGGVVDNQGSQDELLESQGCSDGESNDEEEKFEDIFEGLGDEGDAAIEHESSNDQSSDSDDDDDVEMHEGRVGEGYYEGDDEEEMDEDVFDNVFDGLGDGVDELQYEEGNITYEQNPHVQLNHRAVEDGDPQESDQDHHSDSSVNSGIKSNVYFGHEELVSPLARVNGQPF